MRRLVPILVWLLVAAVGVKFVLLPILLKRAKAKVVKRVSDRWVEEVGGAGSWEMGLVSLEGTRQVMAERGPGKVVLVLRERRKSATYQYSGFELEIESPDRVEPYLKNGEKLIYPDLEVYITPDRRLEEVGDLPSRWGAGPYDRLLFALRTTEADVSSAESLSELRDVEDRLVEKLSSRQMMKRPTVRYEVTGDGFLGLMQDYHYRTELRFRPLHDPEPFWVISVHSKEEPRNEAAEEAIIESMTVRAVGGE